MIDTQSVKTSTSVPAKNQGIDAGKKIVGRKRSIVTDTLGLLLAVLVTAAGVQDSTAGRTLLDQAAADHPGLRKVWVDGGYRQHLVEHAAALGIDMEITARKPGTRGFTPIPKRWAVERTYGWLMLHRRLAVLPCEVGDAAGGWFACERGVSAVVIVGVQPLRERCPAFGF